MPPAPALIATRRPSSRTVSGVRLPCIARLLPLHRRRLAAPAARETAENGAPGKRQVS